MGRLEEVPLFAAKVKKSWVGAKLTTDQQG
jgi:hypothetical protein